MVDKREKRSSRTRHYAAEQEVLTLGNARQRRMRRVGSTPERKPLPVITPRPRRQQEEAQPSRARREKRITKASTSSGTIPVMARGGMESMAVKRPRRGQPKRRYDIPLGALIADAPGAEVRLPALPLIKFSWRSVSGLIVLMLLACLFMAWKSPAFHVSDVQAVGLERLTVTDLNSVMGVLGDSVFLLSTKELEQNLMAQFPELSSVDIQVELPATLIIHATERKPVLAWMQDSSELWFDAQGVSFLPRGNPAASLVRVKAQSTPPGSLPVQAEAASAPLPGTVISTAPQMRLDPKFISAVMALNTIIPADTPLLYNTDYGLGWNDKQHGWRVFFGSETKSIDQKLLVYQELASRLEADGVQPEIISVEYLHAPYYRMER